jgi:solute carrier family 13 (sodium-dependent dicarboxylate transporter), member 2/3/5
VDQQHRHHHDDAADRGSLIAVTRSGERPSETGDANFATAMMLGIAYAASIGGLATLIGSPPNALAASYMLQTFSVEVTFAGWMAMALPVTLVMLPLAWLILTRVAFPFSNAQAGANPHAVPAMLEAMGPISPLRSGSRSSSPSWLRAGFCIR